MAQLNFWQLALIFSPLLIVFFALLDLRSRRFEDYNKKVLWIFIITFLPIVGAMIYFVSGRKQSQKIDNEYKG